MDTGTGIFTHEHTDLSLADVIPLTLTHTYRAQDTGSRAFGIGVSDNYDITLYVDTGGSYTYADLILADASALHYVRTSSGTSYLDAVFQNTSSPTPFYGSAITWTGDAWLLSMKDGTQMVFGAGSLLSSINGNTLSIERDPNNNSLQSVVSPNGRGLYFSYNSNGLVAQVEDNIGRTVGYAYDSNGRLSAYTDSNGGVTSYSYDSLGRLTTITTPTNDALVTNQYDTNNSVTLQTLADGNTYAFNYTLDTNGKVTATDVTDPRGYVENITFNSNGYATSDTRAVGQPEQQQITYNSDPDTDLLLSSTDGLNRTTSYTYDSLGNRTSVTKLAGTAAAATTSYTYDPVFSMLTSQTDALGDTWTYA